jgi:hypothetical protein
MDQRRIRQNLMSYCGKKPRLMTGPLSRLTGRPASGSATARPSGSSRAACPRALTIPARTLTGSSAGLAADADLAERSEGAFAAERRARDAERQRRTRAGKAAWREG